MSREQSAPFQYISLAHRGSVPAKDVVLINNWPATLAIKELAREEELIASFQLRYEIYSAMNYLHHEYGAGLEIDEFDAYAIPFGVVSMNTGDLIASLRLVVPERQPYYAQLIARIVANSKDRLLEKMVAHRPPYPFPALRSYRQQSDRLLADLQNFCSQGERVCELSRYIVRPEYRVSKVPLLLGAFGIAKALHNGYVIGIAACNEERYKLYAKFGYRKLNEDQIMFNESVRELSYPMINDFRNTSMMTRSVRDSVEKMLAEFARAAQTVKF